MEKKEAYYKKPEECKYSFFCHKECEFFPCHKGVPEEDFNCLFCYCPLYLLGRDCGGNFRYTPGGIKDCTYCTIPHRRTSYSYIASRFQKIVQAMGQREKGAAAEKAEAAETAEVLEKTEG